MRSLVGNLLNATGTCARLVAVDGVDGSGKTCFAASLAAAIPDRPVIVLHADDFLNPAPIRHAQGRGSPKGFWEDTYNYAALHEYVLRPLGPSGDGWYRTHSYDPATDRILRPDPVQAPSDALVVLEGMFLHRDELIDHWDASVFLDVDFAETARRMSARDGSNPDPDHPSMRRYVEGQRLYFRAASPWERATLVLDNTDVTSPRILRCPGSDPSRDS